MTVYSSIFKDKHKKKSHTSSLQYPKTMSSSRRPDVSDDLDFLVYAGSDTSPSATVKPDSKSIEWGEETATIKGSFAVKSQDQGLKNYALRLNFTKVGGNGSLITDKTLLVVQGKIW